MYKTVIYTLENDEELKAVKEECFNKLCCECKFSDLCTEPNVHWHYNGSISEFPYRM